MQAVESAETTEETGEIKKERKKGHAALISKSSILFIIWLLFLLEHHGWPTLPTKAKPEDGGEWPSHSSWPGRRCQFQRKWIQSQGTLNLASRFILFLHSFANLSWWWWTMGSGRVIHFYRQSYGINFGFSHWMYTVKWCGNPVGSVQAGVPRAPKVKEKAKKSGDWFGRIMQSAFGPPHSTCVTSLSRWHFLTPAGGGRKCQIDRWYSFGGNLWQTDYDIVPFASEINCLESQWHADGERIILKIDWTGWGATVMWLLKHDVLRRSN